MEADTLLPLRPLPGVDGELRGSFPPDYAAFLDMDEHALHAEILLTASEPACSHPSTPGSLGKLRRQYGRHIGLRPYLE